MPVNALDLLLLTSSLYLYPNSSWYILYYFWLAPYISTQAQVGVSSCLIFLWLFDHGSSVDHGSSITVYGLSWYILYYFWLAPYIST